MTGLEFEEYCVDVLRSNGYTDVKITKASGDQGIDILATKGVLRYAVQCKYYSSSVGNSAVQEAYAGMTFYDCDVAMVMTNSTFTRGAEELAESIGVELWENVEIKVGRGGLLGCITNIVLVGAILGLVGCLTGVIGHESLQDDKRVLAIFAVILIVLGFVKLAQFYRRIKSIKKTFD